MSLRVLQIVSRVSTPPAALEYLNSSSLNPHPGRPFLSAEDLAPILASTEPADAFVRLMALVEQRGGRMPLPVVQWVLGMNRQMALSRALGTGLERRLATRFARDAVGGLVEASTACVRTTARAVRNVLWSLVPVR